MALAAGTHRVGRDSGSMRVHTYREGVAQRVGHDLIIDVGDWSATVDVAGDGTVQTIALEAAPDSLRVLEGLRGIKPLTDKDRTEISRTIEDKILRGQPITYFSDAVEARDGGLTAQGQLSLAGATRPLTCGLDVAPDGRATATLPVTQSEWGIKPYRGLMGALKVRDAIDVVLDVQLPAAG
jgi:hypothetical protein